MLCCCCWITKLAIVAVIIFVIKLLYDALIKPLKAPTLDLDQYWGPGEKSNYKEDASIRSFKVLYPKEAIEKLRTRLNDPPKFITPLENVGFQYGFNSNKLQEIVKYWRTTYLDKWDERQDFLNKYPHFKTQIQGLDIHFVHVKPKLDENAKTVKVLPVILLHGWPCSVRIFYEMIELLTTANEDTNVVFEVICPSLPGFGWSESAAKCGLGPPQMGIIFSNLMKRLGHEKYYIQGGDWGALIGNAMVTLFPENILGFHNNMCSIMTPMGMVKHFLGGLWPTLFMDKEHVTYYYPIGRVIKNLIEEYGYMHIQATKPDTIGTALSDTPIGLAAYILEKYSTWTCTSYRNLVDGGLENFFTKEQLLDNVMVYYLTNCILTSQRLYSEGLNLKQIGYNFDRVPTKVPVAVAKFKYELTNQPDFVIKEKYHNLVQSNHFSAGGHFAPMSMPKVLYQDFVEFIQKIV